MLSKICLGLIILIFNFSDCKKINKEEQKKDSIVTLESLTEEENESLRIFHDDFKKYIFPFIKYNIPFPDPEQYGKISEEDLKIIKKFYYAGTEFITPNPHVNVFSGELKSVTEFDSKLGFEIAIYYNSVGEYDSLGKIFIDKSKSKKTSFFLKKVESEWKLDLIPFYQGLQPFPIFLENIRNDNPNLYNELLKKYNVKKLYPVPTKNLVNP